MITTKGLGFLAVAILLFLLAGLTQVGWLYLIDAVLWGIIVLSAGCPWVGLAFLSIDRHVEISNLTTDSPGPAEGDPVQINLTLRNRAFWPRYVLGMYYHCPMAAPQNRLHRFFVTQVAPSSQVSLENTVEAYRRGMHHLGPVMVESSAPFGLFRRRVRLTGSHPVLVYPKVYPLRRLALADGASGSVLQARKSRTGTDPAGSRRYVVGDPRHLIHWRNTARTAQLMVKELEDPADRTLYLVFDATNSWGEGKETTLEYGIKIMASLVNYAQRNQIPVELLGGGIGSRQQFHLGLETHHPLAERPQLLKELALVNQGDGATLAESLARLPLGATALVAVSAADHAAIEALSRAPTMLNTLVVVFLEGFGESEVKGVSLRKPRSTRTQVVYCRPGQLEEAIRSLEGLRGPLLRNTAAQNKGAGGRLPYSTHLDDDSKTDLFGSNSRPLRSSSHGPSS